MSNDLDEFDEFDEGDLDSDETMTEPPQGFMGRLADLWHNNPAFKIGTIIIGGVALVGTSFALLDSSKKIDPSQIGTASNVAGTPGGQVTPEVQRVIRDANQERAQIAAQTGGSSIPTPEGIIPQAQQNPPPPAEPVDPLAQWRAAEKAANPPAPVAPPQQLAEAPGAVSAQQQQPQPNPELEKMSGAMQEQIKSLLTAWGPTSSNVIKFDKVFEGQPVSSTVAGTNAGVGPAPSGNSIIPVAATPAAKVLQPAGEIKYGSLLTEANSDVDGVPILAEVQTGPLKKARLIGQFEIRDGYLILRFNRVVFKGKEYQSDIIAVDPSSTLAGVATETDERYMTRLVLPMAARFVQGLGEAIADAGTTTTIVGDTVVQSKPEVDTREAIFSGIGDAAQTAGDFAQQQGQKTRPLVRVEAGAALGLFFVQSVTDSPEAGSLPATMAAPAATTALQPGTDSLQGTVQPAPISQGSTR